MSAFDERFSEWLEDTPDDGPPTHEFVWQPTVRVKLCIPPWIDPEDALEAFTTAWNEELAEEAPWYERCGNVGWVTSLKVEGSGQSIEGLR